MNKTGGASAWLETRMAIFMVTAAMGCFAASDTIVKYLSPRIPAAHIAWFRYSLLAASVIPLILRGSGKLNSGSYPIQLGRAVCITASALLLIMGLQYLPVAEATALAFASPLFVTVLSRVFLQETVGPVRWAVVITGFLGVLIVMRPGATGFTAAAFFPIAASLAWAVGMILTRKAALSTDASTTMIYSSVVGLVLLSAIAVPSLAVPGARDSVLIGCMALLWSAAQWFVLVAYQRDQPSRLAPFSYTQMLFATLLGGLTFGYWPDPVALAGISLIVGCGLVAAWQSSAAADSPN